MIPKIIHYCWFGNSQIPDNLKQCMASWKMFMPEYEWRCWNENSFNINSILWTKEAYKAGKYAFVSDYVRLIALYEYGGIYLDTDVKLLKSLKPLLDKYDAFTGFESHNQLTSAIIACKAKHPLIKLYLHHYQDKHFSDEIIANNEANVRMMTDICKLYGLQANNTEQEIEIFSNKLHIFPKTYFCPLDFWHNKDFTSNTYAIHYFDASWLNEDTKKKVNLERSYIFKIKTSILQFITKIYHSLIK